ncbi:MAG: glycosyltransferase, partial [Thermoleophilia bacterium]
MRSPAPTPAEARIDLHLHSRASTDTGSWFLNRAYMPESYTEPEAAYATAKERGMDLVALTDHNTISGALEIAHHPDVVIGVEVTAAFPEDRVPLHVLVWGLDEADWAEIDRLRGNLYEMCDLLAAADLPHALAHPLHRVGADLTADHLERCLLLFRIWEGRNGARPAATNQAATRLARSSSADLLVRLAEKHGIAPRTSGPPALTGGSDDHSGFDIARAWTVTPPARDPGELLGHLRMGRVRPAGHDGTGMGLAHSVGSLAAKAWLERGTVAIPDGLRGIATELLGHAPAAAPGDAGGPAGAMAEEVLARLRADRRLVRRYRRLGRGGEDRGARHHARLRLATGWLHDELVRRAVERPLMRARGLGARAESLAGAGVLALPYLMAAGYARAEERVAAARERVVLGPSQGDPGPARVLLLTHTFNETNGVAGTMRRLADHADARPGCGLRVVTCGAGGRARAGHLDLRALTDVPLPVYGDASWRLGVPSVIELLEAVEASRAEVIHAATPGPLGLSGLLVARTLGIPFVASHHTELARYVLELTGDRLA